MKNYCIDATVLELDGYQDTPLKFVNYESQEFWLDELAVLARYFKNETRSYGLQFDDTIYGRRNYTGFLFLTQAMDRVRDAETHHPVRVLGGGLFVHIEGGARHLDWVWIHPYERNRGLLRRHWKTFKSNFGDFTIEEPLSPAMQGFAAKYHVPGAP